jgi:hypothetical protein
MPRAQAPQETGPPGILKNDQNRRFTATRQLRPRTPVYCGPRLCRKLLLWSVFVVLVIYVFWLTRNLQLQNDANQGKHLPVETNGGNNQPRTTFIITTGPTQAVAPLNAMNIPKWLSFGQ